MASGQKLLFAPEKPLVKRLGKKFFRKIPSRAGVYKMRDAQDNIVYVGKAKNLRQRLRSYRVANPENMARRHLKMVREVARIEFDYCANETAALKHEAKLIREIKPKYNRAGVWQGKPQFLTWRLCAEKIEFAIREVPPVGWERYGTLGSYAPRMQAALVRLLWLTVNPEVGFSRLPHGWGQGKFGDTVTIAGRNRAVEIRMALENLFWGRPEEFLLLMTAVVQADVQPFERSAVMADLDEIQEFIATRRGEAVTTGQMELM